MMVAIRILHSWETLYKRAFLIDDKDPVTAIAFYRQSIEVAKTPEERALSLVNMGRCEFMRGFPDRAWECFSEAKKENPKLSGAWYNLGVMLYDKGDVPLAKSYFEYSLKLDPEFDSPKWYLDRIAARQHTSV